MKKYHLSVSFLFLLIGPLPLLACDIAGSLKQAGKKEAQPGSAGKSSIGLKPLTEMTAADKYKGEDGGLYGNSKNMPPDQHLATAKLETARITPLDNTGKPDMNGKIVLVSISMSNATQEFSVFKRLADADTDKSSKLTIVDCAQGGQAMAQWVDPQGRAWLEADRRLKAANIAPPQVQIAWIKLANIAPTGDLPRHGKKLQQDTLTVLHNAKARFPNLRIAYLGSRIYAGYSNGALNPEPYAYEGAFVVRWLIQDQIKGEANLNFDPQQGPMGMPQGAPMNPQGQPIGQQMQQVPPQGPVGPQAPEAVADNSGSVVQRLAEQFMGLPGMTNNNPATPNGGPTDRPLPSIVIGSIMTINGQPLGESRGTVRLVVNGSPVPLEIVEWTASSAKVRIPADLPAGIQVQIEILRADGSVVAKDNVQLAAGQSVAAANR